MDSSVMDRAETQRLRAAYAIALQDIGQARRLSYAFYPYATDLSFPDSAWERNLEALSTFKGKAG
jgi:hypothetical protein